MRPYGRYSALTVAWSVWTLTQAGSRGARCAAAPEKPVRIFEDNIEHAGIGADNRSTLLMRDSLCCMCAMASLCFGRCLT